MDARKLEHFLAVIEHGQFNLAAHVTGVSQQAVSKAIAKLEEELGVQLFERSAHGAAPTMFARALARRAQTILAETRLANAELNALSGAKLGMLHLGAGLAVARSVLPRTIHRFRAQRPGIGIDVSVDISPNLYQMLLRGELDLVASASLEDVVIPPDITAIPLFMEQDLVMVRPQHPLAQRHNLSLADLLPYPWLTPSKNQTSWQRVCETFGREGIAPPTDVIRTESALLAVGLLTSDDCICLLGREMMTHELAAGTLVALDLTRAFWGERPMLLAYRTKGPLTPAAKAFIPVLREICHSAYGTPPKQV